VTTTEVIALDFSVYNGFGLKTTKPAWKMHGGFGLGPVADGTSKRLIIFYSIVCKSNWNCLICLLINHQVSKS